MELIIGIDFDNTIISYDRLIHKIALEKGLIPPSFSQSKKEIRDHLRRQPQGEIEWQKIQALIYGARIQEAALISGVKPFLQECAQRNIKVYIISHKTEYSNLYKEGVNFRTSALNWMNEHLFSEHLAAAAVHFTSTQDEKIIKIGSLGCTHFIDDLEEVLNSPLFPQKVTKILFNQQSGSGNVSKLSSQLSHGNMNFFSSWEEIHHYFKNMMVPKIVPK